jgi:hypothetical protein
VGEEELVDLDRSSTECRRESRAYRVQDAVVGYGSFAPRILAHAEAHERMLAEAALYRFLDETDASAGRPRLTEVIRNRLGDLLILFGTSLQGAQTLNTTTPAASDRDAAKA